LRYRFIALLTLAFSVLAPITAQAATNGDTRAERNLKDFDFLVDSIHRNYAGWDDKVTSETEAQLAELTAAIRSQVPQASDGELSRLLNQWIAFFGDKHLGVRETFSTTKPGAAAKPARLGVTEVELRRQLDGKRGRAPIEGIWQIDSSYRLAVLRDKRDPDRFHATILEAKNPNWLPGEIKADIIEQKDGGFRVTYYDGNKGANELPGQLLAGGTAFRIAPFGTWTKAWPEIADQNRIRRETASRDLFLEPLSEQTLWLRLPDFRDERADPVKALLEENRAALARAPNLIIDLRDNGGGSDYVYEPIIDLIYTRPIVSIDAEFRATGENIAIRERELEAARREFPGAIPSLTQQIEAMRKGVGGYVRTSDRPFEIITRNAIQENPRHVAVLIDGAGSSGEEFLLTARQSVKVTLYGQSNSAGVLDYANVVLAPSPSGRFNIAWPTSRSLRLPGYPVDRGGIAPDVRIPADVADPISWVQAQLED